MTRELIARSRLWVVKVGSALITDDNLGLRADRLQDWCRQVGTLMQGGHRVVLVSSGAVAEGCQRLGFKQRPRTVHELQAVAAVGQAGLIEAYEKAFAAVGRRVAMVLLTHDDLSTRQRYLNARTTLKTLLDLGVVPIINENDTVATEEIKLGDNDTLAAMVAGLLDADVLAILTDQEGLHEQDPRRNPNAPVVEERSAEDAALDTMAGKSVGKLGRGGMVTKVQAARFAALSGANTLIANGTRQDVLLQLAAGQPVGTLLRASLRPLDARKRWIIGQLRTQGDVCLDAGAVQALRTRGVSVLPVGVTEASGAFRRGDLVRVLDGDGAQVAKGIINYDVFETRKILGQASSQIENLLGYVDEAELIHRDNLVVL